MSNKNRRCAAGGVSWHSAPPPFSPGVGPPPVLPLGGPSVYPRSPMVAEQAPRMAAEPNSTSLVVRRVTMLWLARRIEAPFRISSKPGGKVTTPTHQGSTFAEVGDGFRGSDFLARSERFRHLQDRGIGFCRRRFIGRLRSSTL